MRNAHLESLLRTAVSAGKPAEIERLVRKGAVGDVKGEDGRDAVELVADIEDPDLRVECRLAFLAKEYESYIRRKARKSSKR